MLKKYFFLFYLVTLFIACSNKEHITDLEIKYERALSLNDKQTAISYLHDIIELEPENNSTYTRLSSLYIDAENFEGAIIAANKASKKANKLELKELLLFKYEAYKKTKQLIKAIATLDSLENLNPELAMKYSYDKAELYYEINQYKKTLKIMNSIAKNSNSIKLKKDIYSKYGKDIVSYKHAALNFIGAIHQANKQLDSSKIYYQKILNDTQSFKLVNNNYILLTQHILKNKK
jgi:tetratricopeptide (TPR) repeat protein